MWRSTTAATIAVTTMTPPKIASRSQDGMQTHSTAAPAILRRRAQGYDRRLVRGVLIALSACALLLLLAACGERSEPTGTSVRVYPVTVTDTGGETTVPEAPPQRILALGAEMATTLRALGAGGHGHPRAPPVGRSAERHRPRDRLGLGEQADALARAPEGGPAYVAADGSIDELQQSLAELGLLVARPITAREMVTGIGRSVREVTEQLGTAGRSPSSSIPASSPRCRRRACREISSRKPAATTSPAPRPSRPFDLRHLRQLDPRWYLATSDSGTTLERLRRNPATRTLSAVKAGRFAMVPAPAPRAGAKRG